jgi:hypothetical protein
MATDTAAKKAALTARMKMLDADAERIAQKRADTLAQMDALSKKAEAPAKDAKK